MSRLPEVAPLVAGIREGQRASLARGITLIEGLRSDQEERAQDLLEALAQDPGQAWRIGISGVPGVGKSTFIERFGLELLRRGHRVAVLAVDPSSRVSGGSILGDKSRMDLLSREAAAFIRPSPAGGTLGGIARRTRESMLLCEAAGYDIILVETVGVGQSESAVSDMVDSFLFLALPGAGDELQGIKRGILELVDLIAVHKADGAQLEAARHAARDYHSVARLLAARSGGWRPTVHLLSSLTGEGLPDLLAGLHAHKAHMEAEGAFEERRRAQAKRWLRTLVQEGLETAFRESPAVQTLYPELEREVAAGRLGAARAARRALRSFCD